MSRPPDEAEVIARYLIGISPTAEEKQRYGQAAAECGLRMNESEAALWARMMNHPSLIAPIDSALALRNPLSPIRQRIFIMLAILEATPRNANLFLPKSRGDWFFRLIVPGLRAVANAGAGLILLMFVRE